MTEKDVTLLEEMLDRARGKALRLLSIRPRSEEELRRALKRADYSWTVTETTISNLKEQDMLNDRAFALQFADERRRLKGHAPSRIEFDLCSRGVTRELAHEAAWGIYEEDKGDPAARLLDESMALLRRKQIHYEGERYDAVRRRMASLLSRAGYETSVARDAVDAVVDEMVSQGLLASECEDG